MGFIQEKKCHHCRSRFPLYEMRPMQQKDYYGNTCFLCYDCHERHEAIVEKERIKREYKFNTPERLKKLRRIDKHNLTIHEDVLASPMISPRDKLVYLWLYSHIDPESAYVTVRQSRIAKEVGLSPRVVSSAVKRLYQVGLVTIPKHSKQGHTYDLCLHPPKEQ